jgi:hypothetical protein
MEIKGYRQLTDIETAKINKLKDLEQGLANMLTQMGGELSGYPHSQRWLSLARTHLETGFMFAVKAVTRPERGMGGD